MTQIRVFRIERNGWGPWSGCSSDGPKYYDVTETLSEWDALPYRAGSMPTVYEDKLVYRGARYRDVKANCVEWRHAFPSIKCLTYWFCAQMLLKLGEHGFMVSVYEVDVDTTEVYENQVLFSLTESRLVDQYPLHKAYSPIALPEEHTCFESLSVVASLALNREESESAKLIAQKRQTVLEVFYQQNSPKSYDAIQQTDFTLQTGTEVSNV